MTYQMLRIQQKIANDSTFKILSHSINPEFDTPEVLLEYGEGFGAVE